MDVNNISEFTKGWIIGNFDPSLIKMREIEIGVKFFKKGEVELLHMQIVATEITIVIDGKIEMNGNRFSSGQVITIPPGEPADFLAITDGTLVCVKTPSIPEDKVVL
jgi:quercetin dioxygenase-like cupin family protein